MRNLNADVVRDFLVHLGQRYSLPAHLYLIGGAALCLLGSPRTTLDLDYVGNDVKKNELQNVIDELAREMNLDVEAVPIEQFIPLPDGAELRSKLINVFGSITVSIFDPYSIALSKIARGFDTDIEDIIFLIQHGFVTIDELEIMIDAAILRGQEFDIMPTEVRQNLQALYRRLESQH